MAVLPPMPSMSEASAMAVNPRLLARLRTPKRRSRRNCPSQFMCRYYGKIACIPASESPCVAVCDPHPVRGLARSASIHHISLLGPGGIDRLPRIIFQERRGNGRLDLEAVETAMRSAMHQAGASALTQLLRYDPPDTDHRTIPCACGHSAHYKELRSKTVLTVVGPVELRRPYYLCVDCSKGQYPADAELDVTGLESSPGVRRMEAVVGSEMPFAPACEPMKLLAGLDVPAKAIERAAEAIGTHIAQRDEQEIGR